MNVLVRSRKAAQQVAGELRPLWGLGAKAAGGEGPLLRSWVAVCRSTAPRALKSRKPDS